MLYSALRLGSLHPELSLPDLRRTAIGFAAAAAIFAGGGAHAQDAKLTPIASPADQVTINTACENYKPGVLMADTKCEILKGQVFDTSITQADREIACKRSLITAAKAGKINLTAVPGPGQACKVAKELGLS